MKKTIENKVDKIITAAIKQVEKQNHHIAEDSGLPPELHAFQKDYNPLVFYSRLREIPIDKPAATHFAKYYEQQIYNPIKAYLKDRENKRNPSKEK